MRGWLQLISPKMQGQIRHLLTAFGPILAMYDILPESRWDLLVGILMAVIGFLWSWFAPEKQPEPPKELIE